MSTCDRCGYAPQNDFYCGICTSCQECGCCPCGREGCEDCQETAVSIASDYGAVDTSDPLVRKEAARLLTTWARDRADWRTKAEEATAS